MIRAHFFVGNPQNIDIFFRILFLEPHPTSPPFLRGFRGGGPTERADGGMEVADHRGKALAAMFDRSADGLNLVAKYAQMSCQALFRQDKKDVDAAQARKLDDAEV